MSMVKSILQETLEEMMLSTFVFPSLGSVMDIRLLVLSFSLFPFIETGGEINFVSSPGRSAAYDYIVVGGGAAGCALAATLSQGYKVLLLERGDSPYGKAVMRAESFVATLEDISPDSPSQTFFSSEGVQNTRARILGGGTSINAGFYSRAEPEFIEAAGLDQTLVSSSYEWVENVVAVIPKLDPYQTALRSSLLEAGVLPDCGATYDHFNGTKTGGSTFDDQGNRRPASDLLRAHANPYHLEVVLSATVQTIIFAGKRAVGVEYTDKQQELHSVYVNQTSSRSEIILSAGALGTPQLLMLSGVGPRSHLEPMGINVLVDSPDVGQDMADPPVTRTFISSSTPAAESLVHVVGATSSGSYIEGASRQALTVVSGFTNMVLILHKVARPISKGELRLLTLEAGDNPLVTFNYYSNQEDLDVCVRGMNYVEETMLAESFSPYRTPVQVMPSGGTVSAPHRRNPLFMPLINDTLAAYCLQNLKTIWHYHGGCLPGKVVDSEYKVKGVSSLRVVDGSLFTTSPGTNPQATVMMLGRYMGVKIIMQ